MLLEHEITVPGGADRLFALFNDIERVASCMPGATLEGRDGDAYLGRVTVKIGPITAAYAGSVRFLEVEPDDRRLRLQASGAETHGSGDAEAAIDLVVSDTPAGALVRLTTDLVIRGKIAQFGKGAIKTVSDRILHQFAQNLAGLLAQGGAAEPGGLDAVPAPAAAPAAATQAPPRPAAAELDGLSLLLGPTLSRYAPVAAAFAVGLFEGWLLSRAFGRRGCRCEAKNGSIR
ncbi:SRPBCC family protein [Sphaerisporangium perillae]|uniref:SRPBCC family protein n=1 Tax=Sphaerisporangium perillae TaxID=2935860 RepID=UPI00200DB6BA|nr:SRPBCC family protein [Sphaerisporangium perillae]